MANDVEVRVRVTADTAAGRAKADRDARAAGQSAGKSFADGFGKTKALDFGSLVKGADKVLGATAGAAKGILAVGSAANAAGGIAAFTASLAPLAGGLLLLPGAALGGAAAMATLSVGMDGFGKTLSLMDKPEKFAKELAKLSPEAQKTALAFKELQPAWKQLQDTVQDSLFAGMAKEVQDLGNAYLPMLTDRMESMAARFNAMGKELSKVLKGDAAKNDVSEIFRGMTGLLENARTAAGNFASGLLGIGAVGATYLPRLGTAIDSVAAKFKKWVDTNVENGKLWDWIDGAITAAKQLGAVATNVGQILGTIFKGLGSGGADFLGSLVKTTQAMEDFLKSAQGQSILQELGATLKTLGDVARDVLMTALHEFGPVLKELGPVAREVATAIGDTLIAAMKILGPILQDVARFLSEHKEIVGALVPILIGAAVAIKGLSILSSVVGWGSGIAAMFGGIGDKAGGATGKVAGMAGALKGIGAVVGVGLVANELDKLNIAAAGGDPAKLSGWDENLHDLTEAGKQILTLDFPGIFDGISKSWQGWQDNLKAGNGLWGAFKEDGSLKAGLDGAKTQILDFANSINTMPPTPLKITGDITPGLTKTAELVTFTNGSTGTLTIGANGQPATLVKDGVIYNIDTATGTLSIAANQDPAMGVLAGAKVTIDRTTGKMTIDAGDGPARAKLAALINSINTSTASVKVFAQQVGSTLFNPKVTGGVSGGGMTVVGERGPELVRGLATGGPGSGMRLVGEQGPELVNLPAGSTVLPHSNTTQMLGQSGQGGGGGGAVQVSFTGNTDSALATVIMRLFREGKVQVRTA